MNGAQIHLALTHIPVVLSLTALVILIVSLIAKNTHFLKTSYYILLIAGIIVIPVYLTGESSEDIVESLPGVSEGIIEEHEELAKLAMISIVVTGLIALVSLVLFRRTGKLRLFQILVLILTFISGGLLAQTAHLGGQIRHSEIRGGIITQTKGDNGKEQKNTINEPKTEKDDD